MHNHRTLLAYSMQTNKSINKLALRAHNLNVARQIGLLVSGVLACEISTSIRRSAGDAELQCKRSRPNEVQNRQSSVDDEGAGAEVPTRLSTRGLSAQQRQQQQQRAWQNWHNRRNRPWHE